MLERKKPKSQDSDEWDLVEWFLAIDSCLA